MTKEDGRSKGRRLRREIGNLLAQKDFASASAAIRRLPAARVISPLMRFFYSTDELTKWRAVTVFGEAVAGLACKDMAAAREVMRRLMWNLNEESGGIGWGSPEAMGESMARHEELAAEFSHILTSYACKGGNYLENELLQRGVLWGLGRLAQVYPRFVRDAEQWLPPYLGSNDGPLRGLAARLCGMLRLHSMRTALQMLAQDDTPVALFCDDRMADVRIGRLAERALSRIAENDRGGGRADALV